MSSLPRNENWTYVCYYKEGTVILGGLFPIHGYKGYDQCGSLLGPSRVQRLLAMAQAVDDVNNNPGILPGVTLGYAIFDTCSRESIALNQSLNFIHHRCDRKISCQKYSNLVGVVGASFSTSSILVSHLLALQQIPMISYISTSHQLSDKTQYPFFLRTATPDNLQAAAIVDLLQYFNWTYVSLVYSDGGYGFEGMRALQDEIEQTDICIATVQQVCRSSTDRHVEGVIQKLQSFPEARVVIMFTTIFETNMLLSASLRLNTTGQFVWVGSDGWGTTTEEMSGNEMAALGAITFQPARCAGSFAAFNAGKNNPWLDEMIAAGMIEKTTCNLTSDSCNAFMAAERDDPIVHYVRDAVFAYAHALDSLMKACGQKVECLLASSCKGVTLRDTLLNTTFDGSCGRVKFDANGDVMGRYDVRNLQRRADGGFEHVIIGKWDSLDRSISVDLDKIVWNWTRAPTYPQHQEYPYQHQKPKPHDVESEGSCHAEVPRSVCSEPCPADRQRVQRLNPCCWDCVPCPDNHVVVNGTCCVQCSLLETVEANECVTIPAVWLTHSSFTGMILTAISLGGVICTLAAFFIFLTHHEHPLVKASNKHLSRLILLGLFEGYTHVIVICMKPTYVTCLINRLMFGADFTLIYAPLLTKLNQVYRIFSGASTSVVKPRFIGSHAQVFISVLLVLMQLLLTSVNLILTPTKVMSVPTGSGDERGVQLACLTRDNNLHEVVASILYNLVIILLCAYYAFKTRSLPACYNESRFISFQVYTTVVLWVAFIAIYFSVSTPINRTICHAGVLMVNDTSALICFFGPKIYAVYKGKSASRVGVTGSGVYNGRCTTPYPRPPLSFSPASSADPSLKRVETAATDIFSLPSTRISE
ncbi:metabotropic glutamate receptor 3-like [Branchiostoma lanceolatum]|uniref:metabotropic glutamate receptor 3-like n=1 Tax=Branchiostoma lanceolatum TaxID=7740 RepID=UPI003451EDEB